MIFLLRPARLIPSLIPKQKPSSKMTDDEAAYIEAKGWKASVVPSRASSITSRTSVDQTPEALRSAMPDAEFLQILHLCQLLGVVRTRFAEPELFRV